MYQNMNNIQKILQQTFKKILYLSDDILQVAIKRDAGQELEVQKWICEVLGQPGMFDEAPYEDVLKVISLLK